MTGVGRNSVFILAGQSAQVLAALICLPILVKLLGTDRVGLLSLIWIVIGYFSVLDLGLGRAVTKIVAELIPSGDQERISRVFWSATAAQLVLGIIAGVALAASAGLLAKHVLSVPVALIDEARQGFLIAAFAMPFVVLLSSITGMLQAAQRFDLSVGVQAPMGVLQFILPVLIALKWPILPVIVISLLICRISSFILSLFLLRRTFSGLRKRPRPERRELRRLIQFGGWVTVSSVVSPILTHIDRFIIGSMLTVTAVALYSVPSDAVLRILIIPGALVAALFPIFSQFSTIVRDDSIQKIVRKAVRVIFGAISVPVLIAFIFAADLMQLWMGSQFAGESARCLQICLVGIVFNCLAQVPGSLVQAYGRPDITAKLHLLELPFHLVFAVILIKLFGVAGAAIAWSIRIIVDTVLLFYFGGKIAGYSMRHILDNKFLLVFTILFIFGVVGVLTVPSIGLFWVRTVLAVSVLVFGAVGVWMWFFSTEERNSFWKVISGRIK